MKRISEDHKEIASGKRKDDEGYMARNEMDAIERSVNKLRKVIKKSDTQLPAWVQSKITKAADYIDTAAEYLQSDEELDENSISFTVDPKKLRSDARSAKIRTLAQKGSTEGERQAAERKTKGPKLFGEDISLVEKILGEEKCGKGMYWCNTDKVCKPIPKGFNVDGQKKKPTEVGIGKPVGEEKSCNHTKKGTYCPIHGKNDCSLKEEKDPRGPVKSYKSPQEIAKKHGVSLEAIKKQLEMGLEVEKEHTSSKTAARITALQHLDELPDYYTKLKKVEKKSIKNESVTVEDMFGNTFVEFIDLITPQDVIDEKKIPVTRQAGDFRYSGKTGEEKATNKAKRLSQSQNPADRKRANKISKTIKTVADRDTAQASSDARQELYRRQQRRANDLAKQLNQQKNKVDEAVRLPSQNGQLMMIIFTWRGKSYSLKMFFPQVKMPSRKEVEFELQKVYPGARVLQSHVTDLRQDGAPVLQIQNSKSKNYLLNNGTIGEELEEDWQKVNRQDKTDGLSKKAVKAYRKENPGSKLQTAVTEKNPEGKRAERRKSFCSRMKGMKSKLTSSDTAKDPDSNINKALRRWNCN
jgi:hypothetical protein